MRTTITCKACRRLGMSVCGREKCAFKRKPYPPGVHGKAFRRASSEFGFQLREKQKVKFLYGLRERQFQNYISDAQKQKNVMANDAIVNALELRLDNIVYRLGFAPTRASARQFVNHGHILINGRRMTIPSHHAKAGDEIKIRGASMLKGLFTNLPVSIKKYQAPVWLELDREAYSGRVLSQPASADPGLGKGYNLSAIIEYYSR